MLEVILHFPSFILNVRGFYWRLNTPFVFSHQSNWGFIIIKERGLQWSNQRPLYLRWRWETDSEKLWEKSVQRSTQRFRVNIGVRMRDKRGGDGKLNHYWTLLVPTQLDSEHKLHCKHSQGHRYVALSCDRHKHTKKHACGVKAARPTPSDSKWAVRRQTNGRK